MKSDDSKRKPECFGVFCLTYDLKAVSVFLFLYVTSMFVVTSIKLGCYSFAFVADFVL